MDVGPARYDWREGTLAGVRALQSTTGVIPGLMTLISRDLAQIAVVPPLRPSRERFLNEVRNRERRDLSRWMFGDPELPRERYQQIRRGPEFADLDREVDTPKRRRDAYDLVRALVDLREATQWHRFAVQARLRELLDRLEAGATEISELERLEDEYAEQFAKLERWYLGRTLNATDRKWLGMAGAAAVDGIGMFVPGTGVMEKGIGHGVSKAKARWSETHAPLAWIVCAARKDLVRALEHAVASRRS